jgi:hypothetical protein
MPENISRAEVSATTERKIGKITYLITASPSEKATDTIDRKIEKLIFREMRKTADTEAF